MKEFIPEDTFEETDNKNELRNLLFNYFIYWKWFILSVVLCWAGAWFYLRYATPVYNVSATVMIKDDKKGSRASEMLALEDMGFLSSSGSIENEMEILRSKSLIKQAVTALKIYATYTTKGHIEGRHAIALDCTIDEAKNTQLEIPFKGNVDPAKLEKALSEYADRIPFIIVTITNNTAGGQPVSMQNLREVRAIADKYNKPVLFDSARFAENAYFIKMREEGYQDKSIKEITREMFDLADGMTMSAKKDGIVNMGGFIATRRKEWYEGAKGFCVQYEGYLTYGGMNGRDMNALAIGLDENTEFDNLETRIKQVEYLAQKLDEYEIPYQRPAGGHAIFVDASKVLTHVPKEEFPAQTLTVELYLEAGIRGCEIGYILADRDPITHENRFNGLDLLRLAIPRRVYTDNHMNVIAAALRNVFERRETITRGVRIAWEAPLMRHFTVQLERLSV